MEATLADAQGAWADVDSGLSWPVATTTGATIRYRLKRGASPDVRVGHLLVVISSGAGECRVVDHAEQTTAVVGVVFAGAVATGVAKVRFTSTATGHTTTASFDVVEEWL